MHIFEWRNEWKQMISKWCFDSVFFSWQRDFNWNDNEKCPNACNQNFWIHNVNTEIFVWSVFDKWGHIKEIIWNLLEFQVNFCNYFTYKNFAQSEQQNIHAVDFIEFALKTSFLKPKVLVFMQKKVEDTYTCACCVHI